MLDQKVQQKKESKLDDRNHFLSLKRIIKSNPCTTILVVAKTVTFDHGETQPSGGIVTIFTDPRLSYMMLCRYPDARGMYEQVKELQFGLITLIDRNIIFFPISWNGKTGQVIIKYSYRYQYDSDQWNV